MKVLHPNDFLMLARSYGVSPMPSVQECHYLELDSDQEDRFWCTPRYAPEVTHFLSVLLEGLDHWNELILWPRNGVWPFTHPPVDPNDFICHALLRSAGLSESASGALILNAGELNKILAILFVHAIYGAGQLHDLWGIPDHGGQLVEINHHDVVHVSCRTRVRMAAFVDHMQRNDYPLPKTPPDGTFKIPAWMKTDPG